MCIRHLVLGGNDFTKLDPPLRCNLGGKYHPVQFSGRQFMSRGPLFWAVSRRGSFSGRVARISPPLALNPSLGPSSWAVDCTSLFADLGGFGHFECCLFRGLNSANHPYAPHYPILQMSAKGANWGDYYNFLRQVSHHKGIRCGLSRLGPHLQEA